MKRIIFGLAMTAIALPGAFAQDEFDDIYYNPKAKKESKRDSKKESNYIADFNSMDVDEYNRRGFYYETAVDTIGQTAENAEDFVYTQQIQKYYNPTIVVDNSNVLADILEDSYGNVEIVINNGYPTFTSIYTGSYGWAPSYYNWCVRPSWTWSYAWGPFSWSWNWRPYWSWDPYWNWGYGPSWAYYPTWGPSPAWGYYPPRPPRPHHHGYYSYNRPGAGRPYAPNAGWSHNTRPGGNYNGAGSMARPGSRPTRSPGAAGRPVTNTNRHNGHRQQSAATVNRNNRRVSGTGVSNSSRTMKSTKDIAGQRVNNAVTNTPTLTTKKRATLNNNRVTTTNKNKTNVTPSKRTTSTSSGNRINSTTNNRSYNSSGRNTTSNRRSYNTGTSRHSSGGGSYRSGGGASRGGGGGHRGGHR